MTDSLRMQLTIADQNSLMREVVSIAENINELTAALREQARTDNDAAVLAKVHVALSSLNDTLLDVREMVSAAKPKVDATLTSVASAANKIDAQVLEQLRGELDRDDPESLIGRIHVALTHADASLQNIETITDATEKLVILNRPALNRTIDAVAEAADELNAGINELRTQPWRILFPPDEGEQAKVVTFQAARLFATAAVNLERVTERLEVLREADQNSKDAVLSPEELEALRSDLRRSFEKFNEAETYLWEQVK